MDIHELSKSADSWCFKVIDLKMRYNIAVAVAHLIDNKTCVSGYSKFQHVYLFH